MADYESSPFLFPCTVPYMIFYMMSHFLCLMGCLDISTFFTQILARRLNFLFCSFKILVFVYLAIQLNYLLIIPVFLISLLCCLSQPKCALRPEYWDQYVPMETRKSSFSFVNSVILAQICYKVV